MKTKFQWSHPVWWAVVRTGARCFRVCWQRQAVSCLVYSLWCSFTTSQPLSGDFCCASVSKGFRLIVVWRSQRGHPPLTCCWHSVWFEVGTNVPFWMTLRLWLAPLFWVELRMSPPVGNAECKKGAQRRPCEKADWNEEKFVVWIKLWLLVEDCVVRRLRSNFC